MKQKLIEIFGWYGVGAILLAYSLVSFGIVASKSLTFQILNLTGALGLVLVSLSKKDFQLATLNSIWFVVAIVALAKIVF